MKIYIEKEPQTLGTLTFYTFILFFAFTSISCGLLSSQKPLSEQGVVNKKRLDKADVWLNNEKVGTLENFEQLKPKLNAITKERVGEGILIEGTNIIAEYVYIQADDRVSVKSFQKVAQAISSEKFPNKINTSKLDTVFLLRNTDSKSKTDFAKLNKLILFVSIIESGASPVFFDLPLYDLEGKFTDRFYFNEEEPFEDGGIDGLTIKRKLMNSIEISADDRFFRNEAIQRGTRDEEIKAKIIQRIVEKDSLKNELTEILKNDPKGNSFEILVNSNASVESLRTVVRLANEANLTPKVFLIESK